MIDVSTSPELQEDGRQGITASSTGKSHEGASALAQYITGPPPLRPSGKPQKAGEPQCEVKTCEVLHSAL